MYEANPMAFIVEQAGGAATTGRERIMDVQPTGLHQRVPVFLGSKQEVELATHYHRGSRRRARLSLPVAHHRRPARGKRTGRPLPGPRHADVADSQPTSFRRAHRCLSAVCCRCLPRSC